MKKTDYKKEKKKIQIYQKSWKQLEPDEKELRVRSLEVLSKARATNKSLTKIAKQNGISLKTVLHNTNAFKKVNRRWVAKRFDKIPRSMIINEKGKKISVEINDSRYASMIGKYNNAVKEFKPISPINIITTYLKKNIHPLLL